MAKARLQVLEAVGLRSRPPAVECRPRKRPRPADLRARAPMFKALGDATRLEIVALLAEAREALCACEIEAHFDLSQPTISHHLKILRKAGVLTSERRGTWIYYGLDPSLREQLVEFTGALG